MISETIFITPTTVSDDGPAARRFPQQWFRADQPYLKYPSDSNLVWLREAGIELADDFVPESIGDAQATEICDAFGLFGTAGGMPGPAEAGPGRIGHQSRLHLPHPHPGGRLRHAACRGGRLPRDHTSPVWAPCRSRSLSPTHFAEGEQLAWMHRINGMV